MAVLPGGGNFDASQLQASARRAKDGPQARRRQTLAAIHDGASRSEAARIGGVTLRIVRDWVAKFNVHGSDGLIDRKASRDGVRLDETRNLATMIERGGKLDFHHIKA